MRVVIQRVSSASVRVHAEIVGEIGAGLLVFVGIEDADDDEDIAWMAGKIVNLRIFDDQNSIPNISVKDTGGDILLVSQFTLQALTKKGNRPSYIRASKSAVAVPVYEKLVRQLEQETGKKIRTGLFGAEMKVSLVNEGPVTIWIDSKNKE